MNELGICMEGFFDRFSGLVSKLWPTNGAYLEIGLAHGQTFNGVCTLIAYRMSDKWRAIGIDPTPLFDVAHLKPQQIVVAKKSQDSLAELAANAPYALVLIDGCHCFECAKRDFELVWPHVQQGGVVLFHDYALAQQGGGAQPHENRPIEVVKAVEELRQTYAAQWKEHPEWVGDRKRNNVANMAVFEKL